MACWKGKANTFEIKSFLNSFGNPKYVYPFPQLHITIMLTF